MHHTKIQSACDQTKAMQSYQKLRKGLLHTKEFRLRIWYLFKHFLQVGTLLHFVLGLTVKLSKVYQSHGLSRLLHNDLLFYIISS